MKKLNRLVTVWGITVLAAGAVSVAGSGMSASADVAAGGAVSGSAVGPEVSQENPLGISTMTGAKKAASLKQATLTWTQTGEAQGYIVMRKTGKGSYVEVARMTDGVPGNKVFVDKTVKPGTSYIYQVNLWRTRADGTVETGVCTNTVSVSLVPGKVKGLKAKKSRRKITVTWKKTKNITGYQVYTKVFVKGIKLKYSRAKTLKTKTRKYVRGMLVKGMKYGFKVRTYKKVNGKKIYGPFATVTKRY